MEKLSLLNQLNKNSYPGRGIVVGKTPDASSSFIAYFIMGRSSNSRNRIFLKTDDGIITKAHDPAKLEDPSLIIYAPVRKIDGKTIVTNGDQTDTVYDLLSKGKTFEEALRTRTFEPDAPNFTPRISALITPENASFTYKMSILKSADGLSDACRRYFFEYEPINGEGHFIHTYNCDGNPIPSFDGEPERVEISDDFEGFSRKIWESLNKDNKVSLFTRSIDLNTLDEKTLIFNINEGE